MGAFAVDEEIAEVAVEVPESDAPLRMAESVAGRGCEFRARRGWELRASRGCAPRAGRGWELRAGLGCEPRAAGEEEQVDRF